MRLILLFNLPFAVSPRMIVLAGFASLVIVYSENCSKFSLDRLFAAAGSVAAGVAALNHEPLCDAMERQAVVKPACASDTKFSVVTGAAAPSSARPAQG